MCEIESGSNTYKLNVEEKLRPAVERKLTGTTKLDLEIESLPIPEGSLFKKTAIKMIRWYQRDVSPKIGNRCVFDPSCSHYCELSIRNFGLNRGIFMTLNRLFRCRPKNGGIDLPKVKGAEL